MNNLTFAPPPEGTSFPILFADHRVGSHGSELQESTTPTTLFMKQVPLGCSTSVWNIVDMNGDDAYMIKCSGVFGAKRVLVDQKTGRTVGIVTKNPLFLGKWAIESPTGRLLAQTQCISGMAKIGLTLHIPTREKKATVTMLPSYELNKIEFAVLENPGVITPKNRTPFAMAQYGPNVVSALQALTKDFTFIVVVAPGADVALALCCMVVFDDLAAWNAVGGFAGM